GAKATWPAGASMGTKSFCRWTASTISPNMNTNTRFTSVRYCRATRTKSFTLRRYRKLGLSGRKTSNQQGVRHEEFLDSTSQCSYDVVNASPECAGTKI